MKPTRLWRFTFQPHWRCFSNIVPHASKHFQSCLPLLHPMNIIFQGQYECLGQYGDTGHLSFCFLFALTFSGGCCFTAVFCICSMYGGNSLLDAQTQEPAAANPLLWTKRDVQFMIGFNFNSSFASFGFAWARVCMESLNERYADVRCCLGTSRWSFSCEILVGNQYSFETRPCSISPFTWSLHNRCGLLQSLANPQDLRVLVLGGF